MLDEDSMPVLECFMRNKRPLTFARLHVMTGLNVDALSRLLAALERAGLIWQYKSDDDSGLEVITYRLRNAGENTYEQPIASNESIESTERDESIELDERSDGDDALYCLNRLFQEAKHFPSKKSRTSEPSLEEQRRLIEGLILNDKNCKNALFEHYSLWITGIAHSVCRDQHRLPDLIQVGLETFFNWIPNFDASKGIKLTAFSYRRVRGSMRSFLAKDRLVPIPEDLRSQNRDIAKATEQLQHELGRQPSHEEIAHRTGLSEERIRMAERTDSPDFDSLDTVPEDVLHADECLPEQVAEASLLLKHLLHAAQSNPKFDKRQRLILLTRVLVPENERLPLRVLAAKLRLSVSQVQRLEKAACDELRKVIDPMEDF